MTDEIRTRRLLMRRWQPADRAEFAQINVDLQVMRYFPTALTRQESDALIDRIEAHFAKHGYGLWAVQVERRLVGFTGLSWVTWEADFTPALEVGWRLARSAWGHGYASEAAVAALSRGFQDVDSVISFTAATNEPSQAVMERIGLHHVDDFDHPQLADRHPLRRHLLYRADRETWQPPPGLLSLGPGVWEHGFLNPGLEGPGEDRAARDADRGSSRPALGHDLSPWQGSSP